MNLLYSSNQQIDVTKKYAQISEIKYLYNDIKNKPGVITVNVDDNTKFIRIADALSNFLNTQFKEQIACVYCENVDEDFNPFSASICPLD